MVMVFFIKDNTFCDGKLSDYLKKLRRRLSLIIILFTRILTSSKKAGQCLAYSDMRKPTWDESGITALKRHNQAKIIKKSAILFWVLNITITMSID